MNGMRLLKAIVILGGVLILAGLVLLILRAAKQTNPAPNLTTKPTINQETTLTLTSGNHIQTILSTNQGLAIWATTPEDNAEILLLDANGKLKQRLFINRMDPILKITPQVAPQTPKN